MPKKALYLQPLIWTFIVLLFMGCIAHLAPPYDQAVLDELNWVNYASMELFAAMSGGTSPDSFTDREDKYNSLIGHLYALEIQAKARPVPKNVATQQINKLLSDRGVGNLDTSESPSAFAISKVTETVLKMKDTDKKQGVTAVEVQAFKNQVCIYMDQALTYENFLKR